MFFNKENDGKGPPAMRRRTVPLLPLRDIIVFPHMVSQLFVGRERSINALDARLSEQEQKTAPRAKVGSYATAKTPEKTSASTNVRRDTEESPARRRVRDAMNEFEGSIPQSTAQK